jgi:hypothetical protein
MEMNVLNRRIDVVALSLAGGLSWAVGVAGLALWALLTRHGNVIVEVIGDCYPYYAATVPGALWGLLWGFIDNLFAGKPKTP